MRSQSGNHSPGPCRLPCHRHTKRIFPDVAYPGKRRSYRTGRTRYRICFIQPDQQGFLGGTINEYTRFNSGNDNWNILPRFTPEAIRANLAPVEVLNEFGRTRSVTSAQIALAWLLAKKPWIIPIPGTTKLSHLEENIRYTDLILTATEISDLENAVLKIRIVGDRYPPSEQRQVGK